VVPPRPPATGRRHSPNSSSTSALTADGAPLSTSIPVWLFGNAMTSRIEGARSGPTASEIKRSTPSAKPACGGQPDPRLSSKWPKVASILSDGTPRMCWRTWRWVAGLCIRTEPPPTSVPAHAHAHAHRLRKMRTNRRHRASQSLSATQAASRVYLSFVCTVESRARTVANEIVALAGHSPKLLRSQHPCLILWNGRL